MREGYDYAVSCGAAGSKLFTKFLYPNIKNDSVWRFHLHTRHPEKAPTDARRFIYLFSDPRNAVLSYFQRRLKKHSRHGFVDQSARSEEWIDIDAFWVRKHLKNLGCDETAVHESWTLLDYLDQVTQDVFRLQEHFDTWLTETDRDVLFIRYETMWQQEPEMKRILGLSDSHLPAFVDRAADWRRQETGVQKKLDELYGAFARRLENLPDIFGRFDDFCNVIP